MHAQFKMLEVRIAAPRDVIWDVISDFNNYYQWNSVVPDAHGYLEEGNTLSTTLSGKYGSNRSSCQVREVCPPYYFVLSRTLGSRELLYMEHAFMIHSIGPSKSEFKFVQTLEVSGLLSGVMDRQLQSKWELFRQMNQDLKRYVETRHHLSTPMRPTYGDILQNDEDRAVQAH